MYHCINYTLAHTNKLLLFHRTSSTLRVWTPSAMSGAFIHAPCLNTSTRGSDIRELTSLLPRMRSRPPHLSTSGCGWILLHMRSEGNEYLETHSRVRIKTRLWRHVPSTPAWFDRFCPKITRMLWRFIFPKNMFYFDEQIRLKCFAIPMHGSISSRNPWRTSGSSGLLNHYFATSRC